MAIWNTIKYAEIRPDRFDAEYHSKPFKDNIKLLTGIGDIITIGNLFKSIKRGGQPKYDVKGTVRVLRSVNVGFMAFNDARQEYVAVDFYNKSSKGQVKYTDILITSTGVGTLGRTSIWNSYDAAYCDGHITILRKTEANPFFVTAFLNSRFGLLQFDQNYRGSSGQIEIYPYDLSKIVIPKFLFDYQDEIGNYLIEAFGLEEQSKSYFNQAETLLAKELQLDQLKLSNKKWYTADYYEAVKSKRLDSTHFRDAYSDLFGFLENRFLCKKIGQIVSVNRRGLQPVYSENGTIMVVNSKHLSATHILYDQTERTTEEEFSKQSVAQIKNGDVLIYTTGAYIGLTNAFNSQEKALASNHVNILRLSDTSIDPNYLALVMNSKIGKLQTDKHSRGSAQLELYPADIAKFIIPIISENKMEEIGELVRNSLSALNQSKQLLAQAKRRVEELIEQEVNKYKQT